MHHQSAILHMTENMQWEENLMMQSGMQAVLSYSRVQLSAAHINPRMVKPKHNIPCPARAQHRNCHLSK